MSAEKIKNIWVSLLYRVPDFPKEYETCKQLYGLSAKSTFKYLKDIDEHVLFTETNAVIPITSLNMALKDVFFQIHRLWENQPCNILYTEPDICFIKPTEIFGRFSEFRLFNIAGCKGGEFNSETHGFNGHPPLLNAGVKYFPHTMKCWNIGFLEMEKYDPRLWGSDQYIYNKMFYAQEGWRKLELHPELNYGLPVLGNPITCENLPIKDVHVVHFHGTRGYGLAYEKMRELLQTVGVT